MKRAAKVKPEALLFMDAMREHFGPAWTFAEIAAWTAARAQTEPMCRQALWAQDFLETRRATAGDDWEAA